MQEVFIILQNIPSRRPGGDFAGSSAPAGGAAAAAAAPADGKEEGKAGGGGNGQRAGKGREAKGKAGGPDKG